MSSAACRRPLPATALFFASGRAAERARFFGTELSGPCAVVTGRPGSIHRRSRPGELMHAGRSQPLWPMWFGLPSKYRPSVLASVHRKGKRAVEIGFGAFMQSARLLRLPPGGETTPRRSSMPSSAAGLTGSPTRDDEPSAPPGYEPGPIARLVPWVKDISASARRRAERERDRHASVDVGFRMAERQRRVAAMVLGGGIAYRLLFWLLALWVVLSGVLGFFDPVRVGTTLEQHGVADWIATAVEDLARSSAGNEWWLLLVGGWLVLSTGYSCSKTLVLVHATIWRVRPARAVRPFHASLVFSGYTLGFFVVLSAARWLREQNALGGLVATMLVLGVAFGFWLVVSHALPNAASGWLELVPGAVVVAVGFQVIHLFTIYFLGPRLNSATQLYGVVGVFTTTLFWFYCFGRLIVAGIALNVAFADTRSARRAAPAAGEADAAAEPPPDPVRADTDS